MKIVNHDVYIQKGENWALDLSVDIDKYGCPFMIFKQWTNPYIAITVSSARYSQPGDFRTTYWLNLKNRYVQNQDGTYTQENIKNFISTEALELMDFDANEAIEYYGTSAGGLVVLDDTSDFDIKNFLFYVDENKDGHRVYKYITSYTVSNNLVTVQAWKEYSFRFVKTFDTNNWIEQNYIFDVKVLAGQSVKEAISMATSGQVTGDPNDWTDETTKYYISRIDDESLRNKLTEIFDSGAPLMPASAVKFLILNPAKIFVSGNIQGGVN